MPIAKTADLIDLALNWAVAKAEGHVKDLDEGVDVMGLTLEQWHYSPSTDWRQGGPIMEKMKIGLSYFKGDTLDKKPFVVAAISTDYGPEGSLWMAGPTPLIAAMRCYVASKLGNEVDIPEELL